METRATHLPALDGLRAVAVFTVIVYHFGINAVPGDLGVSAFFVLSGFLITWLLLREHAANGTVSLRRFYTRRVLRIFPAYYAFLAVSFAIDSVRGQPWGSSLGLSSLFYLVNYYNALNGHPVTSIAHAWSLGIEEQFYLLWPMLLLLLLRGGAARAARVLTGVVVAGITGGSLPGGDLLPALSVAPLGTRRRPSHPRRRCGGRVRRRHPRLHRPRLRLLLRGRTALPGAQAPF